MKIIYKLYAFICLVMFVFPTLGQANYIDSYGREWRSLSETKYLSWNQVNSICDDETLLCAGILTNLNGDEIDLTGWTWATADQVVEVVHEVSGIDLNEYPYGYRSEDINTLWAPITVATLGITNSNYLISQATGRVSNLNSLSRYQVLYIDDWSEVATEDDGDRIFWAAGGDLNAQGYSGNFMYRYTPVHLILTFFDESVAGGSLTGDGLGESASNRLNALRNMLEMAGELISIDDIDGACVQLNAASKKCDGFSPPPDFVATGVVALELYDMISELMLELGCD
jgi:hypothetical protein